MLHAIERRVGRARHGGRFLVGLVLAAVASQPAIAAPPGAAPQAVVKPWILP